MTFKEQLTISIIEKLLIGALIVFAGYIGEKKIEDYKSRQAYLSEFSKERVRRISDVQAAMNLYERVALSIVNKERQILFGKGGIDPSSAEAKKSYEEFVKEVEGKKNEALDSIENNQFWLGRELYEKYKKYHGDVSDYYKGMNVLSAPSEEVKEKRALENIQSTRMDIEKVLKTIH